MRPVNGGILLWDLPVFFFYFIIFSIQHNCHAVPAVMTPWIWIHSVTCGNTISSPSKTSQNYWPDSVRGHGAKHSASWYRQGEKVYERLIASLDCKMWITLEPALKFGHFQEILVSARFVKRWVFVDIFMKSPKRSNTEACVGPWVNRLLKSVFQTQRHYCVVLCCAVWCGAVWHGVVGGSVVW